MNIEEVKHLPNYFVLAERIIKDPEGNDAKQPVKLQIFVDPVTNEIKFARKI